MYTTHRRRKWGGTGGSAHHHPPPPPPETLPMDFLHELHCSIVDIIQLEKEITFLLFKKYRLPQVRAPSYAYVTVKAYTLRL